MADSDSQAQGPPLEGIRILDLTQGVAGPYATKLYADYGADVIKIERPDGGDPARRIGPFPNDEPHPERGGVFLHINTGKRSVTLNLKTASGQGILRTPRRERGPGVRELPAGRPRTARARRGAAQGAAPAGLADSRLQLRAVRPVPGLRGRRHAALRHGRGAADHRRTGARANQDRALRPALPRRSRRRGDVVRRADGGGPRRRGPDPRRLDPGRAQRLDGSRRSQTSSPGSTPAR